MTYKAQSFPSNLGQSIADSIVNDAVALGYSCVESRYVHGDMTWAVLKNPASLNYFGADWHMALGYVTNSTNHMVMTMFEGWNTSSKMATAYAPAQTNSWKPTNSYTCGRSPAMLSSGWNFSIDSRQLYEIPFADMTAGDVAYTSITADRLVLSVSVGSDDYENRNAAYVGAYERFLPSSLDPVPLVMSQLRSYQWAGFVVSQANSAIGASTREPGQTASQIQNFAAGWYTNGGNNTYTTPNEAWTPFALHEANRKDTGPINEGYTGQALVSRVPVTGRSDTSLRGLFIGLWLPGGTGRYPVGTEYRWSFGANTYVASQVRGMTSTLFGLRKICMERI